MGECGCGDTNIKAAYRIGENKVLGVEEYPGCRYCGTAVTVTLHFFDDNGAADWIDVPIQEVKFDEYGGDYQFFPLLGKDEMTKAAAIVQNEGEFRMNDYGSLEDLMDDFGLALLQEGLAQRSKA